MTIPPTTNPPSSSILLTGANGSLGTAIALALRNPVSTPSPPQQPPHHLLLTARNPLDAPSQHLSTLLRSLSPRPAFTWLALDLSSLSSIHALAADLRARISDGEFPRLRGVVNSAAVFSSVPAGNGEGRTREGFDVDYGVNALAPLYLVRALLDVLDGGGGAVVVVNVASVAHWRGVVDYFHPALAAPPPGMTTTATAVVDGKGSSNDKEKAEEKLGVKEAFTRYASSKLLLVMLGYALQQRLDSENPSRGIRIVALDPGGMSGASHMNANTHWMLRALQAVVTFLGPVVRMVDGSAINPPSVPARVIAALFAREGGAMGGSYFVLGEEVESSAVSRDVELQERVWARAMGELGLSADL